MASRHAWQELVGAWSELLGELVIVAESAPDAGAWIDLSLWDATAPRRDHLPALCALPWGALSAGPRFGGHALAWQNVMPRLSLVQRTDMARPPCATPRVLVIAAPDLSTLAQAMVQSIRLAITPALSEDDEAIEQSVCLITPKDTDHLDQLLAHERARGPGAPFRIVHVLAHGDLLGVDAGFVDGVTLRLAGGLTAVDLVQRIAWVSDGRRAVNETSTIVLQACHGGAGHDPESGTRLGSPAVQFHRAGFEHVIATSAPWTQAGAALWTRAFYSRLFLTGSLEPALAAGLDALNKAPADTAAYRDLPFLQWWCGTERPPAGWIPVALPPYRPLRALRARERHLFHGRDTLVAHIVAAVEHAGVASLPPFEALRHLHVITGRSGSGKSSLLQCGVLPSLRQKGWETVELAADSERGELQELPRHRDELVPARLGGTLLFIDAFESWVGHAQFDARWAATVARVEREVSTGARACLLIVARGDALDDLEGVPWPTFDTGLRTHASLAAWTRQSEAKHPPVTSITAMPTAQEQVQIVELPARLLGYEVEPGFATQIVERVRQHGGDLPLMSLYLHELWRTRKHDLRLAAAQLHDPTVLEHRVEAYTTDALAGLDAAAEEHAWQILAELVSIGRGNLHHRRRLREQTAFDEDVRRSDAYQVARDRLRDHHLVFSDRAEGGVGTELELAHEAVWRDTPTLRKLVTQRGSPKLIELREAADAWRVRNEPPSAGRDWQRETAGLPPRVLRPRDLRYIDAVQRARLAAARRARLAQAGWAIAAVTVFAGLIVAWQLHDQQRRLSAVEVIGASIANIMGDVEADPTGALMALRDLSINDATDGVLATAEIRALPAWRQAVFEASVHAGNRYRGDVPIDLAADSARLPAGSTATADGAYYAIFQDGLLVVQGPTSKAQTEIIAVHPAVHLRNPFGGMDGLFVDDNQARLVAGPGHPSLLMSTERRDGSAKLTHRMIDPRTGWSATLKVTGEIAWIDYPEGSDPIACLGGRRDVGVLVGLPLDFQRHSILVKPSPNIACDVRRGPGVRTPYLIEHVRRERWDQRPFRTDRLRFDAWPPAVEASAPPTFDPRNNPTVAAWEPSWIGCPKDAANAALRFARDNSLTIPNLSDARWKCFHVTADGAMVMMFENPFGAFVGRIPPDARADDLAWRWSDSWHRFADRWPQDDTQVTIYDDRLVALVTPEDDEDARELVDVDLRSLQERRIRLPRPRPEDLNAGWQFAISPDGRYALAGPTLTFGADSHSLGNFTWMDLSRSQTIGTLEDILAKWLPDNSLVTVNRQRFTVYGARGGRPAPLHMAPFPPEISAALGGRAPDRVQLVASPSGAWVAATIQIPTMRGVPSDFRIIRWRVTGHDIAVVAGAPKHALPDALAIDDTGVVSLRFSEFIRWTESGDDGRWSVDIEKLHAREADERVNEFASGEMRSIGSAADNIDAVLRALPDPADGSPRGSQAPPELQLTSDRRDAPYLVLRWSGQQWWVMFNGAQGQVPPPEDVETRREIRAIDPGSRLALIDDLPTSSRNGRRHVASVVDALGRPHQIRLDKISDAETACRWDARAFTPSAQLDSFGRHTGRLVAAMDCDAHGTSPAIAVLVAISSDGNGQVLANGPDGSSWSGNLDTEGNTSPWSLLYDVGVDKRRGASQWLFRTDRPFNRLPPIAVWQATLNPNGTDILAVASGSDGKAELVTVSADGTLVGALRDTPENRVAWARLTDGGTLGVVFVKEPGTVAAFARSARTVPVRSEGAAQAALLRFDEAVGRYDVVPPPPGSTLWNEIPVFSDDGTIALLHTTEGFVIWNLEANSPRVVTVRDWGEPMGGSGRLSQAWDPVARLLRTTRGEIHVRSVDEAIAFTDAYPGCLGVRDRRAWLGESAPVAQERAWACLAERFGVQRAAPLTDSTPNECPI